LWSGKLWYQLKADTKLSAMKQVLKCGYTRFTTF
jgi:hypothetical protein